VLIAEVFLSCSRSLLSVFAAACGPTGGSPQWPRRSVPLRDAGQRDVVRATRWAAHLRSPVVSHWGNFSQFSSVYLHRTMADLSWTPP